MDLEPLRQTVRGAVIAPADAGYPAVADDLIWNGRKPARAPLAIVRAACAADVEAAVRFAGRHGLPVSARGHGHNWSGVARQEALVIDLAALDDIKIDAAARIASVGPAATSGTLARLLAEHGLAFPVGHCATVPMSGFLLGGGLGWNSGAWGVATWSIESADVVLADGALRKVSATAHPDVFWALQGGGPEFFGVVTGYRLRLQPLPRAITTSVRVYPAGLVAAVESWTTAAMGAAPATLELTVITSRTPGPDGTRGDPTIAVIATIFADDPAAAAAELARIDAGAPAGALAVVPPCATPFEALFEDLGRFFPAGRRYAVDSFWSNGPLDGFVQEVSRRVAAAPSPESFAFTVVSPPADPALMDLPDTAFSMVGQVFGAAYAVWDDPADDGENVAWLRGTADAVSASTVGHYVGEADHDREGRFERCFSPEAWRRLKVLQASYDPQGLFARRRPAPTDAAALLGRGLIAASVDPARRSRAGREAERDRHERRVMMSITHVGACFCGAVEIETAGPPEEMGYCHCSSCRSYSGAPLSSFTLWKADRVRVTRGAGLIGGINKTGMSHRRFCTRCGGTVMTEHPGMGFTDIAAGLLPSVAFVPSVHLNYAEAVLPVRDGLPKLRDFPAEVGGSGETTAE